MGYESAVRIKHSFKIILESFLARASAMSYNELELAAARIADHLIIENPLYDRKSAALTARIIGLVLHFRTMQVLSESKIRRALARVKKGVLVDEIAAVKYEQEYQDYEKTTAYIQYTRQRQLEWNLQQQKKWIEEGKKTPFLNLFFYRPYESPNIKPVTQLPSPPYLSDIRSHVSKTTPFNELLIDSLVHFRFPDPQLGEAYVDEETVRTTSVMLLEQK